MKNIVRIFLSVLMLLCCITTFAEHRFFPANSIHCVNVITKTIYEWDPMRWRNQQKNTYYHYYTGNDTIVDGKPCVMLWKYCEDTPKDKELRFLCEEDGLISYKYPLAEGGYSDWKILYEFPEGGWKDGESYIIGLYQGKPDDIEIYPKPYTLLNGEETQIALEGSLIYGIGYNNWPFLEYWEFSDFEYPSKMQPYSFYRNDTLLWGKPATHGPFFPAHSIRCTNMVTSLFGRDTTYYNIYTGGDTLVDGKECVQLWQYCTDTPENLEQYLLHEVDDKVYIRYTDDGEWNLLYDFSLPVWYVGDSIEAGYGAFAVESIDTITLLNGKKRQVANGIANGGLIHGIGRAYYSYFNLPYSIAEGQSSHPVSFYYWNQLLLGKELPKEREDRFFPANSVYTSSRNISHSHNLEDQTIEFDTIDYNIWTGNDTIVDGRKCVTLWRNSTDSIKLHGLIYESLNGVVYFKYGEYTEDWYTLYDFTPRKWKPGDKICLCNNGLWDQYESIEDVSSVTLHNGEKVPFIILSTLGKSGLIYGIGYSDNMFFSPVADGTPLNFYRNGELLWSKEEKPGTSVATPMVNRTPTPYYDLMGRPVANPTRGIYIKDGRKVAIK